MENKNFDMKELILKIDLDKLTEDERKTFMSLVEKTEKDEQEWKNGDDIFYIALDGEIEEGVYCEFSDLDKQMIEFGNIYKTKEEAEVFSKWLKIRRKLEKFAEEHNYCEINWCDSNQSKYFIYYNYESNKIDVGWNNYTTHADVYFTLKETAEEAIEFIGEERLIKDYFRVKE